MATAASGVLTLNVQAPSLGTQASALVAELTRDERRATTEAKGRGSAATRLALRPSDERRPLDLHRAWVLLEAHGEPKSPCILI